MLIVIFFQKLIIFRIYIFKINFFLIKKVLLIQVQVKKYQFFLLFIFYNYGFISLVKDSHFVTLLFISLIKTMFGLNFINWSIIFIYLIIWFFTNLKLINFIIINFIIIHNKSKILSSCIFNNSLYLFFIKMFVKYQNFLYDCNTVLLLIRILIIFS